MGKLAYESDSVGEKEREVSKYHLPHCGIEGGKELVLGKDVRLAYLVHEGRFSYVGIANKRNPDHLFPPFAPSAHLGVNLLELLLQTGDLVTNYTAVGFYLSFTGATQTDTSALPLEVCPHAGQPGQQILILGQLHLGAGV